MIHLGMRHILLFRSRDWLSANQGPLFPDSIGSIHISFFGKKAFVQYFSVDGIGLQVLYTTIEGLLLTLLLLLIDEHFLLFQVHKSSCHNFTEAAGISITTI